MWRELCGPGSGSLCCTGPQRTVTQPTESPCGPGHLVASPPTQICQRPWRRQLARDGGSVEPARLLRGVRGLQVTTYVPRSRVIQETLETQAGDALRRALESGRWGTERGGGLSAQASLLSCPGCLNSPGARPRLCWKVLTNPQHPGGLVNIATCEKQVQISGIFFFPY